MSLLGNKNNNQKVINICISHPNSLLDFQNKSIFADIFVFKKRKALTWAD